MLIVYRDGAVVREYHTGERIQAAALNTAGTAVGSQGLDAFRTTQDGAIVTLRRPAGALRVSAHDINTAGDIVGEASMPDPRLARWHLPAGTVESFAVTGVFPGSGRIAADGTLVVSLIAGGSAFLEDGRLTPLPTPPGYERADITSLSADGSILGGGASKVSGGSTEPFRWDCRR